jgi:4-amino-4-deoxy-L-arabinose transferase-like glycosyltransferase
MFPKKKPQRSPVERAARGGLLSEKAKEYFCVGIILVMASVLILSNLGNIYLWGDEAQTAVIAKTVLSHGIPLGYDGKNYFSQQFGADYDKNYVWVWLPWFQFYLLAGFFAVFGVSTLTARLPFALMGIGTILLAYYYGKSLWHTRRAGLIAALLLILSVPFLLLVRQCRYYSPSAFFSLAGLYAYSEMLNGRKRAPVAFGVSAFLLFHTHYVYCAALLATTIIHSLIFRRDRLRSVLIASGIVTVVCAPWVVLFAGMGQVVSGYHDRTNRSLFMLSSFVAQIGAHIFPAWLLALPVFAVAWYWFRRRKGPSPDAETLANVALMILFSAITVGALAVTAQRDFFRYLAPLIPVLFLLTALIIESCMRIHPAIGLAVFVLLVSRGQLPDYLYEITHDYDGPNEGIVKYLNQHGHDTDTVTTTHDDLPLKFYTKMRVVGVTTGEDLSAAKDADWFVYRKQIADVDWKPAQEILGYVDLGKYREIILDYPDIVFENREEPDTHSFRTVQDAPRVVIYQRVRE